jgi:hypothetical protein
MFSSSGSENSAFPVASSPFVKTVALVRANILSAIQANSGRIRKTRKKAPDVAAHRLGQVLPHVKSCSSAAADGVLSREQSGFTELAMRREDW